MQLAVSWNEHNCLPVVVFYLSKNVGFTIRYKT